MEPIDVVLGLDSLSWGEVFSFLVAVGGFLLKALT